MGADMRNPWRRMWEIMGADMRNHDDKCRDATQCDIQHGCIE